MSHHWFTTLFSMIVLAASLARSGLGRGQYMWPLIGGLAAGAAIMTVPTRGALVMVAGLVALGGPWRVTPRLLVYVGASAIVPVATFGYLLLQGGIVAAFEDVIVFSATRYASIQSVPFGYAINTQNFPVVVIFPVTALLALYSHARSRYRGGESGVTRPGMAFALAGLVGAFPRADAPHLSFAAPLAIPLLSSCIVVLVRDWRPAARKGAMLVMALPAMVSFLTYGMIASQVMSGQATQTPRGDVVFTSGVSGAERLVEQIMSVPRGAAFFFYPYMPLLPFLTDRVHVARHDVFTPGGYTTPAEYRDACVAAMGHADWIVIDRSWSDPAYIRAVFPGIGITDSAEAGQFMRVVEDGFVFVVRTGIFELRRRTERTQVNPCTDITG